MPEQFDVVIATDCRLPGGTSASVAEELTAQAAAGLRTGLLHVESRLVSRTRPLNPRIRSRLAGGEAELMLPHRRATTRLLIVRHPTVALDLPGDLRSRLDVERCLIVLNQVPLVGGAVVFRASEVNAVVEAATGVRPLWAPIGPLVREQFVSVEPEQELADLDWFNLIDVDAWAVARVPPSSGPIRLGRHSRDHWTKWPGSRSEILSAYPTAADVSVDILGGLPPSAGFGVGGLPSNWRVQPFGSRSPREFLADVDIYVYFHHHDWTEAFGRNLLEAMASGAPVVTHERFRPLLGDAVTYCEPAEVLETVRRLARDPERYAEMSRRGQQLARTRFGHAEHLRRLATLIDIPEKTCDELSQDAPAPHRPPRAHQDDRTDRTVLMISSNGSGMGHLTRLMAIGSRLRTGLRPHFLTLSTAAGVVERQGYRVDYLPSRPVTASGSEGWHRALSERVLSIVDELRPVAVVIDATWPYNGLLDALCRRPEIPVVWCRRGMWRDGVSNPIVDRGEDFFDLVIEPGDFARDVDTGVTARSEVSRRLPPVTLVHPAEMSDRETARRELGLPLEGRVALVTLGAGNINDTRSVLDTVLDELRRVGDVHVATTASPIALRQDAFHGSVTTLSFFPLARHLAAFDLAVAAAGYNSFHELLGAGVPTLFIPNTETTTDDQVRRAGWAAAEGVSLVADERDLADVRAGVRTLVGLHDDSRMRSRLAALGPCDGARGAAALIEGCLDAHTTEGATVSQRRKQAYHEVLAAARLRLPQRTVVDEAKVPSARSDQRFRELVKRGARRGIRLNQRVLGDHRSARLFGLTPPRVQARVRRLMTGRSERSPAKRSKKSSPLLRVPPGVLIDESHHDRLTRVMVDVVGATASGSIEAIVDAIAYRQQIERTFAPVFLTSSLQHAGVFQRYGYVWEHVRRRAEDDGGEWFDRYQSRFDQVHRWYRPSIVIAASRPDDVGDESLFARQIRRLDPT